jgi:hypothetical protein
VSLAAAWIESDRAPAVWIPHSKLLIEKEIVKRVDFRGTLDLDLTLLLYGWAF